MTQQVHPIKKPKCINLIVFCTSTFLVWFVKETTRISNYSSNSWLSQLAVLRIPRGFILNLRHKMITLNLVLIALCHDLNFHKKHDVIYEQTLIWRFRSICIPEPFSSNKLFNGTFTWASSCFSSLRQSAPFVRFNSSLDLRFNLQFKCPCVLTGIGLRILWRRNCFNNCVTSVMDDLMMQWRRIVMEMIILFSKPTNFKMFSSGID